MATSKVARLGDGAEQADVGSYRVESLVYLRGDIETAKEELQAVAFEIFAAYDCKDEDTANACRFLALQKLNGVRLLLDAYTRVETFDNERASEIRLRPVTATNDVEARHD